MTLITLCCLCSALSSAQPPPNPPSPDEQFLAGLRERRLFELAESLCLRQITRENLSHRERTTLAIELARTYAEHALHSRSADRAARFEKAAEVASDFRSTFPSSPRRILVDLQDALTSLALGELARQEAEIGAAAAERTERAREQLRRAVRKLEDVDGAIAAELRTAAGGGRRSDDALSLEELESLENNVAYQLARAYRNQALTYPADSPDRANSLSLALEKLTPLAELAVADDVVWRSRIDRIVCLRLLGKLAEAARAVAELAEAKPPRAIEQRAKAESLRILLAAERLPEALEALGRLSESGGSSAELDFTRLEVMIAALRRATEAKDAQQTKAWQTRATAQVARIEQDHGPYWMRRAETLLAGSVSTSAGGNVAALVRAAESFYRGGRIDEALAQYDRAIQLAEQESQIDEAFSLSYTAAAIAHQQDDQDEALRRFRHTGLRYKDHARAGEAHLLSVTSAADLLRNADTPEARTQETARYEALLNEHLEQFADQPTAADARWRLGKLEAFRGNWETAVAHFRAVPADHRLHSAAVRDAADAYLNWLNELADQPARENVAGEAATFLERVLVGDDRQWPEPWTPLHLDCAVAAARLRLHHLKSYEPAERILSAAISLAADPPAKWLAEARLLLVYALAARGKTSEAAAVMQEITDGPTAGIVATLRLLEQLSAEAQGDVQIRLAEMELQLSDLLAARTGELNESSRRLVELARAAALARTGNRREARAAYERLAARYPRDGEVHEAQAAFLASSTDSKELEAALEKWNQVESKSRSGTDRWFRARLQQARLYHRLDQSAQAIKLIRLTGILQPDLGGGKTKAEFEALLKQVSR